MFTFSCHEGELTYINGSSVPALEYMSPEELTCAEIQSRSKINEMARFFTKNFPGFENAYVSWTCAQIGIRRTRVVRCEYDLSSEEIDAGARFDDEKDAYMSTRNSACCMLHRQAAGTAAALSIEAGTTPGKSIQYPSVIG